jgi:hypothetical protein
MATSTKQKTAATPTKRNAAADPARQKAGEAKSTGGSELQQHGRRSPAAGPSRQAAEHVTHQSVSLPLIGRLPMNREQAGLYAGLGVLAALEVIEWPVAAAVAAGYWLMRRSQSGTLRDFGQALDEA